MIIGINYENLAILKNGEIYPIKFEWDRCVSLSIMGDDYTPKLVDIVQKSKNFEFYNRSYWKQIHRSSAFLVNIIKSFDGHTIEFAYYNNPYYHSGEYFLSTLILDPIKTNREMKLKILEI
jgi:sulfur carrier protein ThiS